MSEIIQEIKKDKNVNISAIDRALAAAKARKAASEDGVDGGMKPNAALSSQSVTPEERAAEKAAKEADRAHRKAARETERAVRRQAKEAAKASKKPAHMKKVERALSRLPSLSEATQILFSEITCNLSAQQIDALSQHLQHHNRFMATVNSAEANPFPVGTTVRVTGGDPKFIGMVGSVVKSRRLRTKVQVPGMEKLVYIFTSQAEVHTSEAEQISAVG